MFPERRDICGGLENCTKLQNNFRKGQVKCTRTSTRTDEYQQNIFRSTNII